TDYRWYSRLSGSGFRCDDRPGRVVDHIFCISVCHQRAGSLVFDREDGSKTNHFHHFNRISDRKHCRDFSTTYMLLLISRIISAASGALLVVLCLTLASHISEPAYRGRAIGLVVMG